MAFIVIYTVGRLKHPHDHPSSREFFERGYKVFHQAERSGDLVADFSQNPVTFPEETIEGEGAPILTMTVWRTLQSLYRFTYSGQHKIALRDRYKWFEPHQEKKPTYVLWWTEDVKGVSWEEAFKRFNYYLQHGATPFAFDFKHAFDESGETFLFQ